MGLDMYFERFPLNKTREELQAEDDAAWKKGIDYWREHIRDVRRVAYWRKVNWLHGFIVRTFAGGVDGCQPIELSRSDVDTILSKCFDAADVLSGKRLICQKEVVAKGRHSTFEDDESFEPLAIDFSRGYMAYADELLDKIKGRYWKVEGCAKEQLDSILPPERGFFFGTYEYDMWYVYDLCHTISMLSNALEKWDINYKYVYQASW